jgi:hypothetical protein
MFTDINGTGTGKLGFKMDLELSPDMQAVIFMVVAVGLEPTTSRM